MSAAPADDRRSEPAVSAVPARPVPPGPIPPDDRPPELPPPTEVPLVNIANMLTVSRLVLVPVFLLALFTETAPTRSGG